MSACRFRLDFTFFFSSRRRHTRSLCDWSSDVCSSDLEDRVGKTGLKQIGRKIWEEDVWRVLTQLQRAFVVDYIVLGGGNAKLLGQLPAGVELGHNRNAYLGGQRVWQNHARTRRPKWTIL